jgi:glycosyltransferase involved in cell wall biosynthesis
MVTCDQDPVQIVVTARDRVSTLPRTLDALLDTTADNHPILVVLGGIPDEMRRSLDDHRWGSRVRFEFRNEILNPQEGRNIGLEFASTRLVAFVDTDVVVRSGWLEALCRCQADTGAGVVVPLILETPTKIHCAGTDLYIDEEDGVRFAYKTLRNYKMPFTDGSNLRRSQCDYGELHCHLVQREPSIEVAAYDEAIPEGGEVDNGLTMREAGYSTWFEPTAVVWFDRHAPLAAIDIPHFVSKWDSDKIISGLRHFNAKWGIDISERGDFINFLADTNSEVGTLARLWPSDRALSTSLFLRRLLSRATMRPAAVQRRLRRRRYGAEAWQNWAREVRSTQPNKRSVPPIL